MSVAEFQAAYIIFPRKELYQMNEKLKPKNIIFFN